MNYFFVRELVSGYYDYKMPITQELCDNFNQSMHQVHPDFTDVTIEDLGALATFNPSHPRANETFIRIGEDYNGNPYEYTYYLQSEANAFLMDYVWDYQEGDFYCNDTDGTESEIIEE